MNEFLLSVKCPHGYTLNVPLEAVDVDPLRHVSIRPKVCELHQQERRAVRPSRFKVWREVRRARRQWREL